MPQSRTSRVQKITVYAISNLHVLSSGYKDNKRPDQKAQSIGTLLAGINVFAESQVTSLQDKLIDGEFLRPDDLDAAVLGAQPFSRSILLLQTHQSITALPEVKVGDKVLLTVNGNVREVRIKGVLKAKSQAADQRIFMNDILVRQLIGRTDLFADEIAVKLQPEFTDTQLQEYLVAAGFDQQAVIRTSLEAVPQFVKDIQVTFNILGNTIGSIGLVVSSITIFIVIFVNAITRRKYIGILKGIGITSAAIQISYVLQALFYAFVGIVLATILIVFMIKPYFVQNPIDFPFSDGIIQAEKLGYLSSCEYSTFFHHYCRLYPCIYSYSSKYFGRHLRKIKYVRYYHHGGSTKILSHWCWRFSCA
ncbi:MAG: hypothetical protein KatS3mg087_1438 [Patescibacteria group bacterium]|nr:MAG: hypothetical protein KatS3mg087_1438 [Patescibacteria group bacterium]